MNDTSGGGGRDRRLHRGRTATAFGIVAAITFVSAWCSMDVAQAAVTSFAMSPASGPPGTVVQVSGNGCAPGVLTTSNTDFVTVTATTLDLVFQAPVASDGSWQATFTVPAGGFAGIGGLPAPVTAVCVSGGLQSLSTIYTPQAFTVTAGNTATTTPDASGATAPAPTGSPTTTHPPKGGRRRPVPTSGPPATSAPGGTVGVPGDGIGVITGGTSLMGSNGVGASGDGAREVAALGTKRNPIAGAPNLRPASLGASLASDTGSGSNRLEWLDWLLLIAVALAVSGASAWFWHTRRRPTREPVGGPA